jgi:hypothetical protein
VVRAPDPLLDAKAAGAPKRLGIMDLRSNSCSWPVMAGG